MGTTQIDLYLNEEDEADLQSHKLTWKQKLCLPLWCWKSFIHDKHEAFRFKFSTHELTGLEKQMGRIQMFLYVNSFIYYIIMFVCPFLFVNDCGKGLNYISHIIYAVYSLATIILETYSVLWI